jgi:long-chain acyl-CoA synthetase
MQENTRDCFFSHIRQRSELCPDQDFLIDRTEDGDTSYSWSDSLARIESVAKSLTALLKEPGQNVSILSKNSAQWVIADLGIIRAGYVSAPLFTTMTPEIFSYVMDFADIKVLFVGSADNWEGLKALVPSQVQVITLPGVEAIDGALTFDEFVALGQDCELPATPGKDVPCSMIFTSGTTGKPKAVLHSQQSFYDAAKNVKTIFGQGENSRFVCYLPLGHIGEKLLTVFHAILVGASITFISSGPDFVSDLCAVRPTSMLGVPRIWEKLLQGVITTFGNEPEALKRNCWLTMAMH